MNAPAKRFSLQRLLTTPPAPAPEPVVARMPDPVPTRRLTKVINI